jgi:hypothetical protein
MLANLNEARRERARRASHRVLAFEALAAAGAVGVTNHDLMQVAGTRAGSRVQELRDEGHHITCAHVDGGLYRYTLVTGRSLPAVAIPDSLPAATGSGLLFDLHALTD